MFELIEDHSSVNSRDVAGAATMLHVTTGKSITGDIGWWMGRLPRWRKSRRWNTCWFSSMPCPKTPRGCFCEQSSDKFYSSLYCYDPSRKQNQTIGAQSRSNPRMGKPMPQGAFAWRSWLKKGGGHSYLLSRDRTIRVAPGAISRQGGFSSRSIRRVATC